MQPLDDRTCYTLIFWYFETADPTRPAGRPDPCTTLGNSRRTGEPVGYVVAPMHSLMLSCETRWRGRRLLGDVESIELNAGILISAWHYRAVYW